MEVNLIVAVHMKVVQVPRLLLAVITTVSQAMMVLATLQMSCIPVTLSGMVNSVRVKVVAVALLHGSLRI